MIHAAGGVRTPRKLLGWRRVLLSGYPLWGDVVTRVKGLVKLSGYFGVLTVSSLAISSGILFYQYKNLPPSTLISWSRLLQDVTLQGEEVAKTQGIPAIFDQARAQGCPVDLHAVVARQYSRGDERTAEAFPWVKEVVTRGCSEKELVDSLVAFWTRLGFAEKTRFPVRESYGKRSSVEAVDVDIGEAMVASVVRFDWEKARRSLDMWGMLQLPSDFLSRADVYDLKRRLCIPEHPESAAEVGRAVSQLDGDIHHSRPQPNRLHLPIKGTRVSAALGGIHAKLLPLVQSIVEQRWGVGSRIWLADVRIVVVDNGAIAESGWSRAGNFTDGPGYTAFIPLDQSPTRPKSETKVTGLLRVLPGSQVLGLARDKKTLEHFHHRFKVSGGVKHVGDVGCVLLDNDCLVRGEENPAFTVRSYIRITYRIRNPSNEVLQRGNGGRFKPSIGGVFEKLSWLYEVARR
jgi:hypothetical protein